MKANVTFNDDGVPESVRVIQYGGDGHTVKFDMHGSTAVAKTAEVPTGEDRAYLGEVKDALEYAETLPFVQAVELKSHGEQDE